MESAFDSFMKFQAEADERFQKQEEERWKRQVELEEKRQPDNNIAIAQYHDSTTYNYCYNSSCCDKYDCIRDNAIT